MRYEVSSKALYNQLLYFRSLWALDKAAGAGAGAGGAKTNGAGGKDNSGGGGGIGGDEYSENSENSATAINANENEERIRAVKEWNRERFQTCWAVVEGYLKRCGRVWVQMDELFRFAWAEGRG